MDSRDDFLETSKKFRKRSPIVKCLKWGLQSRTTLPSMKTTFHLEKAYPWTARTAWTVVNHHVECLVFERLTRLTSLDRDITLESLLTLVTP
jgi:hypothetical protein